VPRSREASRASNLSCRGLSLAEAVRSLGKHFDAVKAVQRRDVKRLFVEPGGGDVSGFAGNGDGSEVPALGVEYLNAHHGADVDAIVAIDRNAVCATCFISRNICNVAKARLFAAVPSGWTSKAHPDVRFAGKPVEMSAPPWITVCSHQPLTETPL
jgi:hypothetical protein